MNLAAKQDGCCLRPSATGAGWSLRRHIPGGLRNLQTLQSSILNRGGSSKKRISNVRVREKAVDGAQEPSETSKGGRRLTHLSELADVFPNAAAEAAGPEDESIEVFMDGEGGETESLFDVFEAEEELAAEGSVAELDEDMLFGDVLEGEEIEDDEEIFNLNSGWSVNAFEGAGDSLGTGFDADDLDDLDEDDDELGMAASELLRSVPSHVVKRLEVEQVEADKFNKEHKLRRAGGGGGTKPKTQRRLRIIGGTASGIRIHSQVGDLTRPMMEKVRGAIFDSLTARLGGSGLPNDGRWLDLFAGTGSVGIEGLSRGCAEGHFIELDSWVVENVLERNLELTKTVAKAAVHQMKAEQFLKKAKATPRFAGGAFDFISMCPPYLLVSYPELFGLLEDSPLVHEDTHIIVEYPKELMREIPDTIGSLIKFRDRKYGRTYIAMYGPE